MVAKLTSDEVDAFLDSRPGWITLTTIGRDGFPHSVPIGYFRLGDDVYIGCRAGTQKLKNIERNPRVSVMLEAGSSMRDIKGLLIQGTATVYTEPADLLRLSRAAAAARGVPEAELPTEARPGSAYIRVPREKVISWDYSRP
jgi:nitroimidazol reductase NimA-like FMN-containing flavoprotein (pyridoxamine 5'-phosphate oxidase superfamily)